MSDQESLHAALDDAARPLRQSAGVLPVLAAGAVSMLVLAGAAWWARLTEAELVALVLGVWCLVGAVLLTGMFWARKATRRLGAQWVAGYLERAGNWRAGALTHLLDRVVEGGSLSLRAAAVMEQSAAVRTRGATALDPLYAQGRRRRRRAMAVLLFAVILFAAARPLEGTPARLWHPLQAWLALTAPVRLAPRTPEVARGEAGVFELTAVGHRQAVLFTRMPGEAWRTTAVALDAEGRGTFTTPPLQAELIARLEAGGRSSSEARISIRLPAFLGSLVVTAHYPAYLGMTAEAVPIGEDTLVLPEGTRLEFTGRATVPLANAELRGPGRSAALRVDGLALSGDFVPTVSGTWTLLATPQSGAALDGDPPTIPLRLLSDSVPHAEIPVPGVDTTAPPSLQLPLLVALHDDHGLVSAAIEWRRGARGELGRMALDLGQGQPDRALLSSALDLEALGLRAGDTLQYQVVASDNTPSRQQGRSRWYRVRIPTEAELRATQAAAARAASEGLDSLAASATRARRQTEDLAKERPRVDPNAQTGDEPPLMSAEAARRAEAVVQAQEQLQRDARKMDQAVDELRRAAATQGLMDSTFAAQLEEIRQLMQQANSPELQQAMAALQQALQQLDPEGAREAMQQLAQKQGEFEAAMKQARELFKRAATENDLANLSRQAGQLADRQQQLTPALDQAARAPRDSASAQAVRDEQALARQADSLAAALDRAAQKMPTDSLRGGLKQAADQARDAAQQMQNAAQQAQQGDQKGAQQNAKSAEQQLTKAQQEIKQKTQDLQKEMKAEVTRELDRALAETTRLAQRELALVEDFLRGGGLVSTRGEQSVVNDAVGRVLAQIEAISGKNAMVPQQIGIALSASRASMRSALESVSSQSPDLSLASTQAGEAVDALTFAAFAMLRAKDRVEQSKSGSGMDEAMEEMRQAAEQQGKTASSSNQQMQSGQPGPEQLMQMAMQQRAVAQQLERLRAGGQMPGAGDMAKEAKALARQIEAGQLTKETAERQQQLYKKMLDAGRQLQGEQDDDERQRKATTAKGSPLRQPAALDPRLRLGDDGIRLPSWETLQRLTPDERRRVLDYFQRLTEGKRP